MLNTTTSPFMNLKPSGQRNFMERMVGLDILTQRADTIKSKNKDLAIEIRLEEQNQEHITRAFDKANDNVVYLTDKRIKWDSTHQLSIKDAKANLEELSAVDTVAIMKVNKDINDQSEAIKELDTKLWQNMDDMHSEMASKDSDYEIETRTRIKERDLSISDIEKKRQKEVISAMSGKDNMKSDLAENKELLNEATNVVSASYRDISTNNSKIENLHTKIEGIEHNISDLESEITTLESGECPYCHQSHFDSGKVKLLYTKITDHYDSIIETHKQIKKIAEDNIQLEVDAQEIESTLDDIKNNIGTLTDEILAIDTVITVIDMKYDKKISVVVAKHTADESNYNIENIDIKEKVKEKFNDSRNETVLELAQLKDNRLTSEFSDEDCHEILNNIKHFVSDLKKLKTETNPYTEQVDKAKKEVVAPDASKLDTMRKEENHYKLLVKLLTDNKSFVRKNLLDQYVPFINTKIEGYLDKLDLPHRVRIQNDLSVDITYMSQPLSYGGLSNGEKGRTNFAVSMAFNDLMSVSGNQFNFLGVDELFDGQGMDSAGIYAVWKILKEKFDNIYVITHREELLSEADEIMTVVKENGFSRIM